MERGSLGGAALAEGLDEGDDLPRHQIGGDADDADRADAKEREGQAIVAREDREGGGQRLAELADAIDRPARFLDRDDVRMGGGEPGHRLDGDLDAAAARNAVEDDRQLDRLGDGAEVGEEALLGRLVVIGGDQQQAVGSQPFGAVGKLDRLGGAVGTGAGDDLDAALGGGDGELDETEMRAV